MMPTCHIELQSTDSTAVAAFGGEKGMWLRECFRVNGMKGDESCVQNPGSITYI